MTDGASESGNGRPEGAPARRRDLRDSLWGKLLLLAAILLVALLASRSCAANDDGVTQDEAVELAIAKASFEPCPEEACRQVRYLQRGIPPVGFWGVVLSERLDASGRPSRTESFLVDAETGEVSRT
jgi:hypothetical protein